MGKDTSATRLPLALERQLKRLHGVITWRFSQLHRQFSSCAVSKSSEQSRPLYWYCMSSHGEIKQKFYLKYNASAFTVLCTYYEEVLWYRAWRTTSL